MMRRKIRFLIWAGLAIPGVLMLFDLLVNAVLPMDLYHPSGELSIRLMLLALLPGPLVEFFGSNRFLRGWIALRRSFGVAAFGYAFLHLVIYMADMRTISAMLGELSIPGIWTGWIAIFAMAIPAAISFDEAMRALGRRWKRLQRLVYPAFLFAIAHWLLLSWDWAPAIIHLAPAIIAWCLRIMARRGIHIRRRAS